MACLCELECDIWIDTLEQFSYTFNDNASLLDFSFFSLHSIYKFLLSGQLFETWFELFYQICGILIFNKVFFDRSNCFKGNSFNHFLNVIDLFNKAGVLFLMENSDTSGQPGEGNSKVVQMNISNNLCHFHPDSRVWGGFFKTINSLQ